VKLAVANIKDSIIINGIKFAPGGKLSLHAMFL